MPIINGGAYPQNNTGSGSSQPAIAVTVATTANINISSAPAIVDNYSLQANDIILVKNQTPDTGNGNKDNLIYEFVATGSPLKLATAYNSWSKYIALSIGIINGNINKGKTFINNAQVGGVIQSTNIGWIDQANAPISSTGSIKVIGSNTVSLKSITAGSGSAFTGIDTSGNITTSKLKLQDLDGAVTNAQTTADVNNTANAIVLRDANGNFIANNITANLDGTANGNMPLIDVSANNNILIATDGTAVDSGKSFATEITGTSTDNQVPTSKSVYDLQSGNIKIHGLWDATANVPHLDAGIGTLGECYSVSVAGSQTVPSGVSIQYKVGDLVYYANNIWNCLNYGTSGGGGGSINTVTATGTDGITMTSTTTDGDVVINASLDDTLPVISSELTTIGTLPTILDTNALADNDNINTSMSKLQGQINNIATSNGFLKNNINVAKNGNDTTNIPLTINGGLSKLDGNGTITLSSGTYDVPTNSINNVSIIGTSVDYCIINSANSTLMPISDNVSYSFSNITFGANCDFTIQSKNVNLSFFNCKFNAPIKMQSQSTGNLYFDRCTVELQNSSTQTAGVNVTFNNSNICHSLWEYGSLYVYNCKYYANSIYASSRSSDIFYVENSDSNGFLIKNFAGSKFRWYNFISPNNELNNKTNGIIIGGTGYLRQLNNIEIGEIYGYEKLVFIKHAVDKNAVITLFPMSKYGAEIDNVTFTINMYIVSPQTITIKVADGSGDKIGDYIDDIRTQSVFKNRSTISLTVIYSKKIFLIN